MKITVQESEKCTEIEVSILCKRRDRKVNEIIDFLQRNSNRINVQNEKKQTFLLPYERIFYIETVDKKVFIYGKDEIYECNYKLYQLEEMLPESHFFRISKSVILNVLNVQSLEPEEGRRLKVTLENEERLIVSRLYVKDIKLKLGIKQEVGK
ncbi:MAG: LytTR family transcriptional regulator [Oscillospiraceae bacterium]|nr:LytTR family transcriptional regulator [Oscillospiraceae bacterium]